MNAHDALEKRRGLKFICAKIAISALATTCVLTTTADAQNSTRPFGGTTDDPSAISLPSNKSAFVVRKFRQFRRYQQLCDRRRGLAQPDNGRHRHQRRRGVCASGLPVLGRHRERDVAGVLEGSLNSQTVQPAGGLRYGLRNRGWSGLSPCWGGGPIKVFRGAVPLNVATGNGFYQVRISLLGREPQLAAIPGSRRWFTRSGRRVLGHHRDRQRTKYFWSSGCYAFRPWPLRQVHSHHSLAPLRG